MSNHEPITVSLAAARLRPERLGVAIACGVMSWMLLTSPSSAWGQGGHGGAPPPEPVVVSRVHSVPLYRSETFIGTTMPIRKSVVGAAFGGRVVEVFVEEGQHVGLGEEKSEFDGAPLGDPIVQLRTTTLDIEIEAARVELGLRELAAAELKTSLPVDIEKAQSDVAEISSRLEFAESVYERHEELFANNNVSERELQETAANFRSLTEMLASAKSTLRKLTSTQQLRLDQATAEIENQKSEIRGLLEMRENYTIRAPFDGYVITKLAELGQWIAPGQAVAELVQLDPIELVVNVPQSFVQNVQRQLELPAEARAVYPATVTVESIDQIFTGELVQIVPQADLRSRTFPVKIRLRNPLVNNRPLIKAGMLANASFFVGDPAEILVVKKDSLVLGPETVVYVVADVEQPDKTTKTMAQPVVVTEGAAMGEWIEIRGGLQAGDRVVVQGNERLYPGQILSIVEEQPDGPPAVPNQASEAATTQVQQ